MNSNLMFSARPCKIILRKGARCTLSIPVSERPLLFSKFHHRARKPSQSQCLNKQVHLHRSPWLETRRQASTRQAATKLWNENPFSVSLAAAIILFGFGGLFYINYVYQSYIIGSFAAYPEPVAAKLRRALYYTNHDLQPQNAIKYYRQALTLADEIGMDSFSDEILGVKIQLSALFEKLHMYQKAIDVLEIVRRDCMRWMEELGGEERNRGKRTRVLGKVIGISVRLGEFYAGEAIGEKDAAEERLVWAVTALLKEQRRREVEGVKEGEGEWMNNEEIGGALECGKLIEDGDGCFADFETALGSHYESKEQHYLAAPLFLQAISLCPPSSCHAVVLMNNLAISLASQNPPSSPHASTPSPSSHLTDARQWALKALSLASSIKPPERNPECDEGCAVATINLGDFAMMEGDVGEARRRWEEGRSICRGIGFREGVGRVEKSLREMEGRG